MTRDRLLDVVPGVVGKEFGQADEDLVLGVG